MDAVQYAVLRTQYPTNAVAVGSGANFFTVCGYNEGSRNGELYQFGIPSTEAPAAPIRTTDNPGAYWMGSWDVVARIVNGFDVRALNLPFVQAANQNNNAATNELAGLGYFINWNGVNVQDAIDFAVSMIQVAITVQRFTAGTQNKIGGTADVGGPIDVAVVRPGGTVEWVQRKRLHA